jgi:dTDP-4-dehydrorhamnose reductase
MKVVVAGAGGMLGRDFVASAANAGHDVVGLERARMDVADADAVRRRLDRERPDMVVNCAAWTDVDGAETAEDQAFAVNGTGAGNVAAAAREVGAAVLYVSTDYVFDGEKGTPYVESDQPAPLSAYARTKLAGEEATAAANKRHFIVRSSGLFGIGGKNFVDTMLRLAADRDAVAVVTDQVGCPTFTGHLARGLVTLAENGARGVMHVAGGGRCSWNELAREVFAQAGMTCEVRPAKTEDMGRPAPRPAFSVLGTERADAIRLPPWRDGVAAYLGSRVAS